jgi:hypothetical protein
MSCGEFDGGKRDCGSRLKMIGVWMLKRRVSVERFPGMHPRAQPDDSRMRAFLRDGVACNDDHTICFDIIASRECVGFIDDGLRSF